MSSASKFFKDKIAKVEIDFQSSAKKSVKRTPRRNPLEEIGVADDETDDSRSSFIDVDNDQVELYASTYYSILSNGWF